MIRLISWSIVPSCLLVFRKVYAKELNLNLDKSYDTVEKHRICEKIPGMVVGISYRGKPVWIQPFGYANLELLSPCNENTVMRIGSISKPITTLLVAKLVEEKKLDLDKSIYDYVGNKFPRKLYDGKQVEITLRNLLAHTSGIRGYKDNEFYLNQKFSNVFDALKIFSKDDLVNKPGTKFLYSTYAWTLLAAVVESVLPSGTSFCDALINLCRDIGMDSTYLDENQPIILNRAAQYEKNHGQLVNAPEVNSSYKHAGGGLISSVPDLLKFGNVMLYSYKGGKDGLPGFLKKSTVETFWSPDSVSAVDPSSKEPKNGLGWFLQRNESKFAGSSNLFQENLVSHKGTSVGGKACILIIPEHEVIVALIVNTHPDFDTLKLATKVAQLFIEGIQSNAISYLE